MLGCLNTSYYLKMTKEKKPFDVCLTHDIDRLKKTYQYFTKFLSTNNTKHLHTLFYDEEPYWCLDKIQNIERSYGVKSTFFFLNESIKFNPARPKTWKFSLGRYNINSPKIVQKIKELDINGNEIGVHGSVQSYNNSNLLKMEKMNLEKIIGKKINGSRQHFLRFKYPETWNIQRDLGFKYDSTFGFRNRIGFKGNIYRSFEPFKDGFKILPIGIMDTYLFSKQKTLDDYWQDCVNVINQAQKNSAILVIIWHNRCFYELDYPNYTLIYKRIIEECLDRGANFKTCSEALNLADD